MARLKMVEQAVKAVLTAYPDARDDDFILINRVYQELKFGVGSTYFDELMTRHKELHLPSFESITRARRKLQQEYISLRASAGKRAIRELEQDEFRSYARGEL